MQVLKGPWYHPAASMAAPDVLGPLIGDSPVIVALRDRMQSLIQRQADARRFPPILIEGETGTGKGLVARLLHRASARSTGAFVDINCAAIPETLLEAELFGFERGAFTDAREAKAGLFESAHGGTMFLDEIGLLPERLQGKLLKAVEERAVRRLGSILTHAVDVQIIAAGNQRLEEAARAGRFREDLYHRLAVLTLQLPPLRQRGRDVVAIAEHFLKRACADYGLAPRRLSSEAHEALLRYPWPGNVRELSNVIERVALLSEGDVVTAEALGLPEPEPSEPRSGATAAAGSLDEAVRDRLRAVLAETGGNLTRAAAKLGIARNTLLARMTKYGLRARPSPPERLAQPAESTGVRWDKRWLAFLRVELTGAGGGPAPLGATRPLEVITEKIHSFGGRVEELSPGMAVGIFGVDPVDDAARRAAHAALAIQTAAQRARGGELVPPALRMTIGIDEVLVARTERGAVIDAAAKRSVLDALGGVAGTAAPDSISVSERAARFLERRFELVPAGGGSYHLLRRERPGFVRSQFVGRAAELGVIHQALERVRAGHGHVVAVVGDPGVGKSRLVWEATHGSDMPGCRLLETQAVPHADTSPYFPVTSLLRTYFGVDDRDDLPAVRDKVVRGIDALDSTLAPRLRSPLLALLEVPVEDEEWNTADPPARRQRTLEACALLLVREARRQPLVLVWEDLHWIDSETQAVLDRVVESLPTARILLLAVYRPEYRQGWGARTYYSQVPVDPLPPERADELVTALLGEGAELAPLRRLLAERTEGNPFFVEESVRTLVETGAMAGEPGAYRLTRPIHEVPAPTTVQAVLAARIDRLPPEQKGLVQAAAVIGKEFPLALLQAIARRPEMVARLLADLGAAEFIYERAVFPDVEYTFKHALTHEVVYESLLVEERKASHARVLVAIETLYRDRLSEHVERLAHHAVRGERWEQALSYLRQAGAKAAGRSAHREAVSHFEEALAVLERLPETPERLALAVDLRFDLRGSLLPLGEIARLLTCLREAEPIARRLGDELRLGWVSTYLTIYFALTGHTEESRAAGEVAVDIARRHGDSSLHVVANSYLGQACYMNGQYRRAVGHFRTSVEALTGDRISERFGQAALPSVYSRALWAWAAAELGDFAEGAARGEEALRIAEDLGQPFSIGLASIGLGASHTQQGDVQAGIPVLERGLELCRARSIPLWLPMLTALLGYAYLIDGKAPAAIDTLERAVQLGGAMKMLVRHSHAVAFLAEAYLAAERIEDAAARAREVLALATERAERGLSGYGHRLLADIAARRDDAATAAHHHREAMGIAQQLEMRPLRARCHLGLGRLEARAGKPDEAREHLAAAITLMSEMSMRPWLEQASAELTALNRS
jgi:DNA-binding NtrC family response regulator/tetratricopeptide (TPR) repeat protein